MSYCDARRRECSSSNCFVRNQMQHNCVRGACAPHTCFARKCCCTSISRACLRVLATYVEGDMAHMPLKQLIHVNRWLPDCMRGACSPCDCVLHD